MANNQYLLQLAELKRSYLAEGIINNAFIELEDMDVKNPYFLEEVINDHFDISSEVIETIEDELRKVIPDFNAIGRELERYKESSIRVGAQKVTIVISQMLCMWRENVPLLKIVFERLKEKALTFQSKIDEYMAIRERTLPEEITDKQYEFDNDDDDDSNDDNDDDDDDNDESE